VRRSEEGTAYDVAGLALLSGLLGVDVVAQHLGRHLLHLLRAVDPDQMKIK
jgi:hypothetical protein